MSFTQEKTIIQIGKNYETGPVDMLSGYKDASDSDAH